MAKLNEVAVYEENVLRLDIDTPIKGYDGKELGPANSQAQALANRTKYLKLNLEQLLTVLNELSERAYVASVNDETGAVTLTYEDVGAAAKEHTHKATEITPTTERQFASEVEKRKWNNAQEKLVSGQNIKTVTGQSLLGSEDIQIYGKDIVTDTEFQLVSEAEIAAWNDKQNKLVSGKSLATIHDKNLLTGTNITLNYDDVGAEKKGAVDSAIDAHVSAVDPHEQYLTKERGNANYVSKDGSNKPNGYLQLDEKGQIPAAIAKLFEVRYIIASNKDERLAITGSNNVTICLQTDENRIYYLDAGGDPSVEENWHNGRDADPSSVISVFDRSGVITAEAGDYNADQITETETRVFVKPEEKTSWTGKQDALVSGKNIRTLNKNALLGSGDISITPESIGAAAKEHTHSADEITTTAEKEFVSETEKAKWNGAQEKLVSSKNIKTINQTDVLGDGDILITPETIGAATKTHSHATSDIETDETAQFVSAQEKETWDAKQSALKSGENISTVFGKSLLSGKNISLNDVDNLASIIYGILQADTGVTINLDTKKNKIEFAADGGGGGNTINTKRVTDAQAGTEYRYPIESKPSTNFRAYGLLKYLEDIITSTDVTYNKSYFDRILSKTGNVKVDDNERGVVNTQDIIGFSKSDDNEFYFSPIIDDSDATRINVVGDNSPNGIIQTFTGTATTVNGKTAKGSTAYSANYGPQRAFGPVIEDTSKEITGADYFYTKNAFNKPISSPGTWVGIDTGMITPINSYTLTRIPTNYDKRSGFPISWELQGSKAEGDDDWVTIEKRDVGDDPNVTYYLDEPAEYRQYRIAVVDTDNPTYPTRIIRFQIYYRALMLVQGNDGTYYTLQSGQLVSLGKEVTSDTFENKGFYVFDMDVNDLSAIAPYRFVSNHPRRAYFKFKRRNQIVVNSYVTDDNTATRWNYVSQVIPTYTGNNPTKIKVAVSPDGATWFTLDDNDGWVKYDDQLAGTVESANLVMDNGIPIEKLSTITEDNWKKLYTLVSQISHLGLAFATESDKTVNNQITPDKVTVKFYKPDAWELKDVNIKITDEEIIFTPSEAGDYKFCYKVYN